MPNAAKNPTLAIAALTRPTMKVFTAAAISQVEKEVNTWLQTQEVKLLHVTQSQSEQGGRFVFTVSLFYMQQ